MPTKPAVPQPRIRAADGSFAARGTVTPKLLRKIWTSPTLAPARPTQFAAATPSPVEFFSKFTADKVDTTNAIIRGVSVMTSGLIARGHDLEVDGTTLDQVKTCAESKTQVPVKVNHKSGAEAVCGYLTNFHLDGSKLKADWHLLKTHSLKDTILEVAERMPGGVGLSASFLPPEKTEKTASGKKAARCAELLSVDYVTLPAANPDGMFSAKVDSTQTATPNAMSFTPEQIESLKSILAEAVAPLTEKIDALEAQQGLLANPPSLEELANMSDEELAGLGLTAEDVADAIAEAQSAEAGEGEDGAEGSDGDGTEGEVADGEGAAAPVAAGAGATGLSADVQKQLTQFAAELRAAKAEREQAVQDELVTELSTKFDALVEQNKQLQAQLKTGGTAASHGAGTVNFRTKTGVQVEFGTKESGEFEQLVVEHLEADPKATKATAFTSVIKENPEAYREYRARLGVQK
jgi:hypothetical protein